MYPQLVKDINPGRGSILDESAVPFLDFTLFPWREQLIFSADDGSRGTELWSTDGTPSGTRLLANLQDDPSGSSPRGFIEFQGQIFFEASDGLWTTDGTTDGTQLFSNVSSSIFRPVIAGNQFFFSGGDNATGQELWVSNGTAAGTRLVRDIEPGPESSWSFRGIALGNCYIFAAEDSAHGREPWVSDGTTAGTVLLRDIVPSDRDSWPSDFVEYQGRIFFSAHGEDSLEMWATDGTPAGTEKISEQAFVSPIVFDDRLFFGSDANGEVELWVSDGTTAGTQPLYSIASIPDGGSGGPFYYPQYLTVLGDRLLFMADSQEYGFEWWVSDGTPDGTNLLKDINPGRFGAFAPNDEPYSLAVLGDRLYFPAYHPDLGVELWSTDGTTAGTQLVGDIAPGSSTSFPVGLQAFDGQLYFAASDGTLGYELWRFDPQAVPLSGAGGQRSFTIQAGDGNIVIEDFGSVGRGVRPSAAVQVEADTLVFRGEGMVAEKMLLNQVGNNLEIRFAGVPNTRAILLDTALEDLDNLERRTGASVNWSNVMFSDETRFRDSFDVVNVNDDRRRIFNRNHVTFLNDRDNRTWGFSGSDDVINTQGGDDWINGRSGRDWLRGGAGDDTLIGDRGNDMLVGNEGDDQYMFDSGRRFRSADFGVDRLVGLEYGDRIVLSHRTFSALRSDRGDGLSDSRDFATVTRDADVARSSGILVYNTTNGKLFYNANGAVGGLGGGAQFAVLNDPIRGIESYHFQII